MEAQSIQEYEKLEKYYWWFVGRRQIIGRVLEKYFSGEKLNILDWGCGPGGNFSLLGQYGQVLGVDASEESISACKQKGITNVLQAVELSELKGGAQYDLVTNFDVLEHISDDRGFLQGLRTVVKPGGHVLVTVPAYQFLWSSLDEALGHKRRYTRKEISEKFARAGYQVMRASYFIFFLSPAFVGYRMFEKLIKKKSTSLSGSVIEFPKLINWLFTKTLSLESILIPFISLPFGTSIIVLAKKKKSNE